MYILKYVSTYDVEIENTNYSSRALKFKFSDRMTQNNIILLTLRTTRFGIYE